MNINVNLKIFIFISYIPYFLCQNKTLNDKKNQADASRATKYLRDFGYLRGTADELDG